MKPIYVPSGAAKEYESGKSSPYSRPLAKNPNWKGGKVVTAHGYVKIKNPKHPSADMNGYVYEHRLVMERILGRYLSPSEIVHHKNGDGLNNSPENLELTNGVADHKTRHRKRDDLRRPDEPNPLIACACGCGDHLLQYDSIGRPRKYLHGHYKRNRTDPNARKRMSECGEKAQCACGCGADIERFDYKGRERKFVSGHNLRRRIQDASSHI